MKTGLFFKLMNHSCAVNVSQALGITGRILSSSAACSTSCQAIGYGYEMIAFGKQDYMLCGGADELHPLTVSTFDIMNAASVKYNGRPAQTPRPFDRDRDGVVCSEGSGILLLESLDSAKKRNAKILAEIIGFATTADVSNIANPEFGSMIKCIELVLEDAQIGYEELDYINAHATATIQGDIAESRAIRTVFGESVPVSSLKGHLGHTMAACGAIETASMIQMMKHGIVIPTLNLENVDEACRGIRHVRSLEKQEINIALKNNFALGGVNSSLVLRRYANG
jgi:3-oxoacyl-[acyl-carrier-protein] synthase II